MLRLTPGHPYEGKDTTAHWFMQKTHIGDNRIVFVLS